MMTAPVTPGVAFAFLADPRNAPEWFAPVTFAPDERGDATVQPVSPATQPVSSALRLAPSASVARRGATWRFIPNAPASRARTTPRWRAAIPMRMVVYEPPMRFAWETTYSATRDNLRWEITCAPAASGAAAGAPAAHDAATAATTATTPVPTAEPETGVASSTPLSLSHTTIHLTLRIQPGPLGWVSLLMAAPFTRGSLDRRAQSALDRARETLADRAELAAQPRPPHLPRPHSARGDERRGERRKRRR